MTNATLADLPSEIILQILSYFLLPTIDHFWASRITSQTLLPSSFSANDNHRSPQIEVAKQLTLVCRKLRLVCVNVVWAKFECKNAIKLRNLHNVCAEEGGVGSYIQELDLYLPSVPSDQLKDQLTNIWPRLRSLRVLTLTLTPAHPCSASLATQLNSLSSLRTLRLVVMGDSLGPHLRALSKLKELYIEIHPPNPADTSQSADELVTAEVSREVYHNWTRLFNDFVELVESCVNVTQMGWFVDWMMVHVFYRHVKPGIGVLLPNNPNSMKVKCIQHLPPNLASLSVTLESQMGTLPFLHALSSLPITDLAVVFYDNDLLSGSSFRDFCQTFKSLRRLRLRLCDPSIAISRELKRPTPDKNSFIEGITSLPSLKAYKGPILLERPTVSTIGQLLSEIKYRVADLAKQLLERGAHPDMLVEWSVLLDGLYGSKLFNIIPDNGPRGLGNMIPEKLGT